MALNYCYPVKRETIHPKYSFFLIDKLIQTSIIIHVSIKLRLTKFRKFLF